VRALPSAVVGVGSDDAGGGGWNPVRVRCGHVKLARSGSIAEFGVHRSVTRGLNDECSGPACVKLEHARFLQGFWDSTACLSSFEFN